MCSFSICSTAQLKTMHSNETGPDIELEKVLENMKTVREQYENQVKDPSIWNSNVHNAIGWSSKFSTCQNNRRLIVFYWHFLGYPGCSCSAFVEFEFLGQIT